MKPKQKILIVRLSSIGDVLLATPLLRIIKKTMPDSDIDFLTYEAQRPLLDNNLYVENVITLEKKSGIIQTYLKCREFISPEKYDLIIDLQNSIKSRVICMGSNSFVRRFDKRRKYKLKLIFTKKRPKKFDLIPDLYINVVPDLNLIPDEKGLEFWLESDKAARNYVPVTENDSKIIGIAPGAYHFTKRLPVAKFIELAQKLQKEQKYGLIILGGKSDEEICSELKDSVPTALNYAGKTTLPETASLVDKCCLIITNDTSIMHIAASRQVPCLAIYGSTVPEFGFIPYNSPYKIIQNSTPCRPCTHYGRSRCPKGHFKCMNDLSVDDILNKALSIIENKEIGDYPWKQS